MKNIKWWQWILIIVFGIPFVGATISVISGEPVETGTNDRFEAAQAKFDVIGGDGVFAMTFNVKVDPETLPDIAREQCGDRKICKIIGWTDPKFAARAFPMTDREVEAQAFQYTLNRNTGFEQVLWDCRKWMQTKTDRCL